MQSFKILSIDGGGIRGIMPVRILCDMEDELRRSGSGEPLYKHFDLICGTSTGGIIAIGLALGMSAKELLDLYKNNASKIFGGYQKWAWHFKAKYDNKNLYELLKSTLNKYSEDGITRLGHAKTRLCIPTYNAELGKVHIYKTPHRESLIRDYQIPAHDVAMSTAAAPLFFSPHSFNYSAKNSSNLIEVKKNIDGGVIANNPTLIGLTEAHNSLGIPYGEIKILSLGTGHSEFYDSKNENGFGLFYWNKARLMDLIFSAQSQTIDNIVKLMNVGVGEGGESKFYYKRVQYSFKPKESISLDSTNSADLKRLEMIGTQCYKEHGAAIFKEFLSSTSLDFLNFKPL